MILRLSLKLDVRITLPHLPVCENDPIGERLSLYDVHESATTKVAAQVPGSADAALPRIRSGKIPGLDVMVVIG